MAAEVDSSEPIVWGPEHSRMTYDVQHEVLTKRWPKKYWDLYQGKPVLWCFKKIIETDDYVEEIWEWRDVTTKKRKRE